MPPDAPPLPAVRFEVLEPNLRTGDLMLLHGTSSESVAIEDITHSPYSHVGMIVRPDRTRPALVWQTGPAPIVKDPQVQGLHAGAQLGLASDVFGYIADHGEAIYVRQMEFLRTPDFEKRTMQVVARLDGTPFPTLWQMAFDWAVGHLHISTTSKHEYCAQLVADTLIQLGLLGSDPPMNDYSPGDFGVGGAGVKLLLGATLRGEFLVEVTPATAAIGARALVASRAMGAAAAAAPKAADPAVAVAAVATPAAPATPPAKGTPGC